MSRKKGPNILRAKNERLRNPHALIPGQILVGASTKPTRQTEVSCRRVFSGDCTCSGHQDAEEELNELSPCLLANKTDEGKSHREKYYKRIINHYSSEEVKKQFDKEGINVNLSCIRFIQFVRCLLRAEKNGKWASVSQKKIEQVVKGGGEDGGD